MRIVKVGIMVGAAFLMAACSTGCAPKEETAEDRLYDLCSSATDGLEGGGPSASREDGINPLTEECMSKAESAERLARNAAAQEYRRRSR